MLMDRHTQGADLLEQRRMRTSIAHDLTHARKQAWVVQHWLVDDDAVLTQLSSIADQPSRMSECPHRNWPVVGRHTSKLGARY
jgi:hypothetical protein